MNDVDATYDTLAVQQGFISVTPLTLYQQDHTTTACAAKMEQWEIFKSK